MGEITVGKRKVCLGLTRPCLWTKGPTQNTAGGGIGKEKNADWSACPVLSTTEILRGSFYL